MSATEGISPVWMEGRASRTSSLSCVCQCGCVARSQTAQVIALLVVSCLKRLAIVRKRGSETYPAAKNVNI